MAAMAKEIEQEGVGGVEEPRPNPQRRSGHEKALAEHLTEQAKKKVPNAEKFRQAKMYARQATRSQTFEDNYGKSSIDGLPIHHFYQKGEFVIGIIGESQGEIHGPSSYPFQIDLLHSPPNHIVFSPPRIIRLPGNRRLAAAIRKADCLYQRIKVTYLGKKYQKLGGWYEKVYLVESAPLDKEPMTQEGRELLAKAAAEAETRKAEGKR
jgi:hypothetical protein